jgi:hypothetical protein
MVGSCKLDAFDLVLNKADWQWLGYLSTALVPATCRN